MQQWRTRLLLCQGGSLLGFYAFTAVSGGSSAGEVCTDTNDFWENISIPLL